MACGSRTRSMVQSSVRCDRGNSYSPGHPQKEALRVRRSMHDFITAGECLQQDGGRWWNTSPAASRCDVIERRARFNAHGRVCPQQRAHHARHAMCLRSAHRRKRTLTCRWHSSAWIAVQRHVLSPHRPSPSQLLLPQVIVASRFDLSAAQVSVQPQTLPPHHEKGLLPGH